MRRREFLAGAATVTAAAFTRPLFAAAAAAGRPNILMIPVDDLKPLLSCYGNADILTPNIDRLAARGTVFRNNVCQQAVCGPTRASLMTGLYPDSTGVWDLATRMRDVHPDVLSLPQHLARNGYATTGVGKTYDSRCVGRGADEVSWSIPYASEKLVFHPGIPAPVSGYQHPETREAAARAIKELKGQSFRSGGAKKNAMTRIGGPMACPASECLDLPDDAYADGALAAAGCRLLETLAAANQPFFLSVGFYKPHLPFVAPKRYWDLYDPDSIRIHPFQQHAENSPELAYHSSGELRSYSDIAREGDLSPEQQVRLIHGYRACVSYIDAQVGKLLAKLDELGLSDRTIVCLWGDHGWHLGDHGMWCKHSNFEQATRAPLIIAAPNRPGGVQTDAPTGHVDVFPTLCDLAGVPRPTQLQGTSLVPLMENPRGSVREASLSQYPRSIDGLPVMGYALRDRRYRYVKWLQMAFRQGERSGRLVGRELYDYHTDPMETVSQADNTDYAEIVARFEGIFARMNVAQHTGIYEPAAAAATVHGVGRMLFNGTGTYLESRIIPVAGEPFAEACEVRVIKVPERTSMAAYKRLIMIPITAGKTYRLRFSCRSDAGAHFSAVFQQNGRPHHGLARQAVTAGPQWQQVELTATASQSFDPRGTVLTCHLGSALQSIQFADVRIEEVD